MEIETMILPAYWASALVNDDWSGLEEFDCESLREFLEAHPGYYCVGCSDNQFFSWSNEWTCEGCDCLEYTFHINE